MIDSLDRAINNYKEALYNYELGHMKVVEIYGENIDNFPLQPKNWEMQCMLELGALEELLELTIEEKEEIKRDVFMKIESEYGFETSKLQKSPNWDQYCELVGSVYLGFPFNEGFPKVSPFSDTLFVLITSDGSRHRAKVDFDTQYRSEGLKWRTIMKETIHKQVVIAWKELFFK